MPWRQQLCRREVREGFGGVWGGGEADSVLQGQGGISRNFEEFGNR